MAVWAQHADVVGSIVLPISVDVLDLERYQAGKWITFIPAAAPTFLADCFDDVAAHGAVEIETRW
jgi:hypothetical protein